jgi:2-hydroxy-6-oxo-octa-2,4-dienoate hydrolase
MTSSRPEIGSRVVANGIGTNYLQAGDGAPVVLVHGSGPGVSSYANWRLTIPHLSQRYSVYAPDMVGFGFSDRPDGVDYTIKTWTDQLVGFLDALGLERVSLVGNSFGGALALRTAGQHPDRVDRLVLMGSVGVPFPITEGLDAVWGYEPSFENMRTIMDYFAYNRALVNDELAEVRFRASTEPGFHESYSAMFPAPRQRWVDAMATPDEAIAGISAPTLVVHGREDQVIPVANSFRLLELIPNAQLHVFGHCGHWTQIEWADEFATLVSNFLSQPAH